MTTAAGILFVCGERALFLQRADSGMWAFPGGHIEEGETAEQAAIREAREELGSPPPGALAHLTRRIAEGVDYTTFVTRVDDEFEPALNGEHTAWTWAPIAMPPEPLHPGCRVALARLSMDELGLARAIAAGDLVSPQRYGNLWLFAIRITGTGMSYRAGLNEYVWRDSSLYLTEDFLARCNGLPIVWEHPEKKPKLDSKEFNDRVIGAVMLPYIKGDEVWAVSRIYDEPAAVAMASEQLSTSPGVVFRESSGNQTVNLEDGSHLLIEGRPAILDHCAVVTAGVWDKGGPPTGVLSNAIIEEPIGMTDEEKAAADKARKDADTALSAKLDAIMGKLDSAHARLDAAEKARADAENAEKAEQEKREREEGEKEKAKADAVRRDAYRKDRFGRKDGESDEDRRKRWDADEKAMMDACRTDGDGEDVAAKCAKDARTDAEETERKDRADKARKDAEEKQRMDSATATELADVKRQLAAMTAQFKHLTAEVSPEERNFLAAAQARADGIAGLFGERAPAPIPGETSLDYRKRLLGKFQKHSARFKETRFDSLDASVLGPVEEIVYADSAAAARSPSRAANGILIPIREQDEAGRTITRFTGDILGFIGPFIRGGQIGRFNVPAGRAN